MVYPTQDILAGKILTSFAKGQNWKTQYCVKVLFFFFRPEGKKYEKALEWGIKVVNSKFLADIIHNGQLPTVLSPKYTVFNQPNEFSPASCQEPLRIIGLFPF